MGIRVLPDQMSPSICRNAAAADPYPAPLAPPESPTPATTTASSPPASMMNASSSSPEQPGSSSSRNVLRPDRPPSGRVSPLGEKLRISLHEAETPGSNPKRPPRARHSYNALSEACDSMMNKAGSIGRVHQRNEEFRRLFCLPEPEFIVDDWPCALKSKQGLLLQGRLFSFVNFICFYSNVFGCGKKIVMSARDIMSIKKRKNIGVIPNSIEILFRGKPLFFTSFLSRDDCFSILQEQWGHRSDHPRLAFSSEATTHQPYHAVLVATASMPAIPAGGSQETLPSVASSPLPLLRESASEGAPPPPPPDSEGTRSSSSGSDPGEVPAESEDMAQASKACSLFDIDDHVEDTAQSSKPDQVVWNPLPTPAPPLDPPFKPLLTAELPCTTHQFFVNFLQDSSQFWRNCLVERGDKKVHFDSWIQHNTLGNVRNVDFVSPVKASFGPSETRCSQSQRYTVYAGNHLTLDTSQVMLDIPYGDHFTVEMRWDVTEMGPEACRLQLAIHVRFSRKTMFRGTIEKATMSEAQESFSVWVARAKDALQAPQSHQSSPDSRQQQQQQQRPGRGGLVKRSASEHAGPRMTGRRASDKSPEPMRSSVKQSERESKAVYSALLRPETWVAAAALSVLFLLSVAIFSRLFLAQAGSGSTAQAQEQILGMQQQMMDMQARMTEALLAFTAASERLSGCAGAPSAALTNS